MNTITFRVGEQDFLLTISFPVIKAIELGADRKSIPALIDLSGQNQLLLDDAEKVINTVAKFCEPPLPEGAADFLYEEGVTLFVGEENEQTHYGMLALNLFVGLVCMKAWVGNKRSQQDAADIQEAGIGKKENPTKKRTGSR